MQKEHSKFKQSTRIIFTITFASRAATNNWYCWWRKM